MKKRFFSWLLTAVLLVECTGIGTIPVLATEADVEQTILTEEIAALKAEDITITSVDVPYQEIEWSSGDKIVSESATETDPNYQIALVLDTSGSMSGTAITELRQACYNFIDDILTEDEQAEIAIVTFDSEVTTYTFNGDYFSNDRAELRSVVGSLTAGGGTAMNAGVRKADDLLQQYGSAPTRFVIQMADGEPNSGSSYYEEDAKYYGDEFTDPDGNIFNYSGGTRSYASAIYNSFLGMKDSYNIYSLGFFHSMSGTSRQFAATFLNDIQNMGYFEVIDADNLSFSFENIAQSIGSDYLVLNKSSLALSKGSSEQLAVAFTDAYTSTDKNVTWGSTDVKVATVDTTGKVTAKGEGSCFITAQAGGYQVKCAVTVGKESVKPIATMKLYIYQNLYAPEKDKENNVVSEGATVVVDGTEYKSGEDGCVTIPKFEKGEIVVSKVGHTKRTITFDKLKDGMSIVLQQESDNPVISAIWIDDVDALRDDYPLDLTETEATTISVEVDWGNNTRGKLRLGQGAEFAEFPTGSNTISIVLKEKYDITEELYVLATDSAGNTGKEKIKFETTGAVTGLNDLKFSIGNSVGLQLPKKLPLIGGKEVSLDAATGTLPITATVEDGKVYITIGIDVAQYAYSDKYATSSTTKNRAHVIKRENQKLFENIKEASLAKDIKDSAKKLKNIKQKYKTAMRMPQGSFGFNADFSIIGYAEGYVDSNNKFVFMDGGVILNPSVSLDWSGQFAIGPVPCYWEAQIAAAVQAQLNLYKNSEQTPFLPAGKLEGEIAGSVGAGIGVNKVATIGGGGTLKFKPSATFYDNGNKNYFSLTTSISLYFKIKVACFEYKYEPDPLKSITVDNGVESASLDLTSPPVAADMYVQNQYEMENLNYLTEEAETDLSYMGEALVLNSNTYSQTEPKLVGFDDGTKLMVFIDSATNDVNDIKLYYSYYDGLEWSEPLSVSADETADFSPDVCVIDNKAYVVWQDVERAMTADDTLDTIAKDTGIKLAVFDGLTQTFGEAVTVTDANNTLDMMPTVTGALNNVSIVWVRNTDNSWFGASADSTNKANVICSKSFKNAELSAEQELYTKLDAITSITADYDANTLKVAYCLDTDSNMQTMEDAKLYLNGERVTDSEQMEATPLFVDHALYWFSDGSVQCMEDVVTGNITSIGKGNLLLADSFMVVGEGANRAILYTQTENLRTAFYGMFYQPEAECFGQPICLNDVLEDYHVSDFSAIKNKDGMIEILANRMEVNGTVSDNSVSEETYGNSQLAIYSYDGFYDLEVTDCIYESGKIVADSVLPVTVQVKNTGTQAVENVLVEILNEKRDVIQEIEVLETILSGETKEIDISCLVKADDIGSRLTIRCTLSNHTLEETAQNTYEIELSYEDIKVSGLDWGFKNDTTVLIHGSVVNEGFSDAKDVKVTLYLEEIGGEKLAEYTVPVIKSMEQADISFTVPYEEGAIFHVAVSQTEKEVNTANNSDYVRIYKETVDESRNIVSLNANLAKTSYYVGEALDLSGLSVSAVYSDGTKLSVKKQAIIDVSKVNMNVAGEYTITISYDGKQTFVKIKVAAKATTSDDKSLKVGQKVTSKNAVYVVTSATEKSKTVKIVKSTVKTKSLKKLSIPASVKVNGVSYTVTAIGDSAFKNKTSLKSVTIPKNVTTIGKNAFSGCKKLTTIKISSKKLKSIGKNAFKGILKKATFKVPSSKLKAYKKMLQKKKTGYQKKWKIKKG